MTVLKVLGIYGTFYWKTVTVVKFEFQIQSWPFFPRLSDTDPVHKFRSIAPPAFPSMKYTAKTIRGKNKGTVKPGKGTRPRFRNEYSASRI